MSYLIILIKGYGPRFHRDTQTYFWKNRYSQSVRDHSTQMVGLNIKVILINFNPQ